MLHIFELQAKFDPRKSFYGKAHVIDHWRGYYELQSYDTIVSKCRDGIVTHLGKWSQTTSRHHDINTPDDIELHAGEYLTITKGA